METNILARDGTARLIGIPLISFTIAAIMHINELLTGDPGFLQHWFMAFFTTLTIWEGCRQAFFFFRRQYPGFHQTRIRLITQGIFILIYTFLVAALSNQVCHFLWSGNEPRHTLLNDFLISLIPTAIVTMVYESVYFFDEWKKNVQKTESLARENVQSQLETLKNQLDPHFLFNSLNTLAALIDVENEAAGEYLEKLSDVYRYVLTSRDKNTVTLAEEMNFLDDYVYLNKVRFRDNLQITKAISPEAYHQLVAPLSLQMLVENAIKHNIVSKEKPLHIRIVQEEGQYLSVVNNLEAKVIFETSTKVGLQNIANRYKLLSEEHIEIKKEASFFKVRLPLLQPSFA
ncbi:sensor histidine kinase [Adhaeribacter pallidiroseus]|uniref:Sensor protein LytS n=1 Tax=Adhaeribacter pallidiroseus TaxID=2072847 RepID=A0A369QF98_9BACT|nr:histidine kinase [Adhaeribacter pallidiroseus]RDC61937.1 Sensor protein LytS [Adhaeribacter pallidiroseus]